MTTLSRAVTIHDEHWRTGGHVAQYANRTLFPPEVIFLARYHERLVNGRVLEVGCGAGRLFGYLLEICRELEGIDLAEDMLAYCRETYPACNVHLGDVGALARSVQGPFDVIIAPFNVLSGFEDSERRRVLGEIRELLASGGLLIFSSHNYDAADERGSGPSLSKRLQKLAPERVPHVLASIPRSWVNRRRLRPAEYRERDHAMLTDSEGQHAMLHYYIGHAAQERQLCETGYEMLECIDVDGRIVDPGRSGKGQWLHYVARPATGR